jgi:Crinkler effector protein N-terminal domain
VAQRVAGGTLGLPSFHHRLFLATPSTLFCIVIGRTTAFPVTIGETQSVGELKDAIKKKKAPELIERELMSNKLTLYSTSMDPTSRKPSKK